MSSLIMPSNYKPRKRKLVDDKPLYNKDNMITRDISFELQFGFKDTLDIPYYEPSSGLDVVSTPKDKPIKFD